MTDFLILYKNNAAKIGRSGNLFKVKSFYLPAAIVTENNSFLTTENGAFLVWDSIEEDSLVYRLLSINVLPSPEIDTNRILYGD